MSVKGARGGIKDWFTHRLLANYWSLPMLAVLVAPLTAGLVLWGDAQGAGRWMLDKGLALFSDADTAQDAVAALIGVNIAFLTLYWSVVLIVPTLATGNLGVRLVDRWLDKRMVRRSMACLTFCLVFTVIVFTRIDADLDDEQIPHFALVVLFVLTAANIAVLGVAIHDLARTMFIDRSLAHIGRDASSVAVRVTQAAPHTGGWDHVIAAPRKGYINSIDLERVRKMLDSHSGVVRFCAAPGHFILEGEPLVCFENAPPDDKDILSATRIGDYRSSLESTDYQLRLLVEVAARALPPAVNDFYTALACIDQIASAIAGHAETWIEEGTVAVYEDEPRFELPGQHFRGLFDEPLKALRQSANSQPTVMTRMIDNCARVSALLAERKCAPGLIDYIEIIASEFHDHALMNTDFNSDREDIKAALARLKQRRP